MNCLVDFAETIAKDFNSFSSIQEIGTELVIDINNWSYTIKPMTNKKYQKTKIIEGVITTSEPKFAEVTTTMIYNLIEDALSQIIYNKQDEMEE